jgi:uncharacterized protein HemY
MWMWKAIDKFGLFIKNIFVAFKFAAYDYDVKLRRTKTTKQRIIIWLIILIVIVVVIYLFLLLISHSIKSVIEKQNYFNSK